MDVLEEDKKELRNWLVRKRNKRDLQLQKHVRHVREQRERLREQEEERRQAAAKLADAERGDDPVWSAKTQEIRNRLTDKKRDARERWNRFAGTGDEGGRGL